MKTTQQINVKWLPQCQLSHKNLDGILGIVAIYNLTYFVSFLHLIKMWTLFTYVSCEIDNNGIQGYSLQCLAMDNAIINN